MVFIELTPFVVFREDRWTDDVFGDLQRLLLAAPDAGDLIPGGGGLRKIRWAMSGRGKRGGARVIYYWHATADCIYLIYGYDKARRVNLTPRQLKTLRALLGDLTDG